jgi:CheY-like chemotaxis protein
MNILIVDDEEVVRDSFKKVLGIFGHNTDTAASVEEAIKLLEKPTYNFIFVDYNMPGKSGLELLKHIKEKCPLAKTAMLTGYPMMKEEIAKFAGVDEYLQKPFDAAKVIRLVNKYHKE